ncbi:extracellular solute-binding protein [Paenibacillus thalictri]|uniref:Extracellular solute-binding protein n=1 Tax=Paenibacillus thalictri TaxID=2527873 RepID=A0A4Q9DRM8_9BACL|nr:extracellular solute-binding protein [Paenibacillus thalictri]TBL78535.1 extracellular solute-binding protein [Paenibacillus thalictri]
MGSLLKSTSVATMSALLAVAAAGCGGDRNVKDAGAASAASDGNPYPKEISYWVPMNGNASPVMKSYSEMKSFQALEKKTGTKVNFQHPPAAQAADQFNLVLASGALPDVIEYNWSTVARSPDSLIKDKQILNLTQLIKEHAPNLNKVLESNPEFRKLVTTDEGNIYTFPFLLGDPALGTTSGPIMRKDWLDKLNLKAPTTIDEWETVLTAFRDRDPNGNGKKDEIPLSFAGMSELEAYNIFIGAWGITPGFYQNEGKVRYGSVQPEYKQFLTLMAKWYKEGLLDKDFASGTDSKVKDAKVTGDQLGAFVGFAGSGLGRYLTLMQEKNPQFALVGVKYPSLQKDGNSLGQYVYPFRGLGASISAKAKEPEKIAKWLDYKYGEEGHLLFSFGIEGESYTMVNNAPKFTDLIMKNPDKLPVGQAMAKYLLAMGDGPFVQDIRWLEQYYELPAQREAHSEWKKSDHSKILPPISLTSEESSKVASIMNDVKTYRDEMFNKFIMGVEPLDNFDKYVQTINKMGLDKAIESQQAALDRYNKRK